MDFTDDKTLGNLRASWSDAREASFCHITDMHMEVACSPATPALFAPLQKFHSLDQVTIEYMAQPKFTSGDMQSAADSMAAILTSFGRQPDTLIIKTPFTFPLKLCIAISKHRKGGLTVIQATSADHLPRVARLSDAYPPASLSVSLARLFQLNIKGHSQLTSITLTNIVNSSPVFHTNDPLARFTRDGVPHLASLRLLNQRGCELDLGRGGASSGGDLAQLRTLQLEGFWLVYAPLGGLARRAPNLTTLIIRGRGYLGVPQYATWTMPAPEQEDGVIEQPCWTDMTSLCLDADTASYFRQSNLLYNGLREDFWFPPALTFLDIRVPADTLSMPLHSSTFNSLSRLRRLHLQGIRFHKAFLPAFCQLHDLRHVTLGGLDISASDYSFPAQQIAIQCPHLELLALEGNCRIRYPHFSSSAMLQHQLKLAKVESTGRRWIRTGRLWPRVPLQILSCATSMVGVRITLVRE